MNNSIADLKEIDQLAKAAARKLRETPNAKIFVPSYIVGEGWIITEIPSQKSYSLEEFKAAFGYLPALPHPSELLSPTKKRKQFWEL